MAGGVIVPGNRVRIKGRKASVIRFFSISVAYTVVWIALSSQLGHYRAEYGPQILLQLSVAYYLPSIPVLLLSPNVEKLLNMLVGECRTMQYRLLFGLAGCTVIAGVYPFMHHQLLLMLCAVMVLGATSAIAFSTSYQLVAWFRAADTIALGIGCVGSGPIVLFLQVALGLKVQPAPWQWIVMFHSCALIAIVGIACTMSLFWQYGDIISGRVPYVEKPLLDAEGEEEEVDEEDEFEEQNTALAAMLSRMVSVADPFQGMPLHFAGYVDEGYARMLRAHGLVRRVASADSDLGFLRITAPTSGLDYSVLSRLPMKGPLAPHLDMPQEVYSISKHKTDTASMVESTAAVAGWKGRSSITSQLLAEFEQPGLLRRVNSHQSLSGFDEPGGPLHEPATGAVDSTHGAQGDTSGTVHAPTGTDAKPNMQPLPPTPPLRVKPLRVPGHIPNSAPPTFEAGLTDTLPQTPPWEKGHVAEARFEGSSDGMPSVDVGRGTGHDLAAAVAAVAVGSESGQLDQMCVSHADILNALEKGAGSSRAANGAHEVAAEVKTDNGLQRTREAFKQVWLLVLWSLASATIINLVFPFFTYIPSSGWLGDYLPQWLFYIRIMADICGRFLPRLKGPFTLKSSSSIVMLAMVMCAVASMFFVLLHKHWDNDWVWVAIVAFLWFTGGFINTNSFTLAPNMVDSMLTAQASAIMALTYQLAHFLGLVLAAVSAYVMFGNITGQ